MPSVKTINYDIYEGDVHHKIYYNIDYERIIYDVLTNNKRILIENKYTIDKNKFVSKGHNTPFDGWKVKGKVLYTICDGKIIFENQEEK